MSNEQGVKPNSMCRFDLEPFGIKEKACAVAFCDMNKEEIFLSTVEDTMNAGVQIPALGISDYATMKYQCYAASLFAFKLIDNQSEQMSEKDKDLVSILSASMINELIKVNAKKILDKQIKTMKLDNQFEK